MLKICRLVVLLFLLLSTAAPANAQPISAFKLPEPNESYMLWPTSIISSSEPDHRVQKQIMMNGIVHKVLIPHLDIYAPRHPNGTAILIIAGGGYNHIEISPEAIPATKWLLKKGVTAGVLYYRLPKDGNPPIAPFQDAQRAMRLFRAHAPQFGINPHRIGVLGFSAGGNLAAITETRFQHSFYRPIDETDLLSSRPDFAALIYPVISVLPPYNTNETSRKISVQPDAPRDYSAQLYVTKETPPTFLAQSQDDQISNVRNSEMMFAALQNSGIPSELHVFEHGRHGWGMGKQGTESYEWPRLFNDWAISMKVLPAEKKTKGLQHT